MKRLTSLVVMTLLVLGFSSAFVHAAPSGPVQFDLQDFLGDPFCDYLEFSYGSSLAAGIDRQTPCAVPFDGTLMGVVTTVPGSSGFPVTGSIVMLADGGSDVFGYSGIQPIVLVKTRASLTKYGWEEFYNVADDPTIYFVNYGYLLKHNGPLGPLDKGQTMKRLMALPAGAHPATKN